MTKAQLIKELAEKKGIERAKAEAIVEAFMNVVKEQIMKNETVYLRGFGTFATKKRAAKIARNIGKNTEIKLPAHRIPSFKPSKKFAEKVKKIAVS